MLVPVTFPDRTRIEQSLIVLVTTSIRLLPRWAVVLGNTLMCIIRGRPMASALAPLKNIRAMWLRPLSMLRVPTSMLVVVRCLALVTHVIGVVTSSG